MIDQAKIDRWIELGKRYRVARLPRDQEALINELTHAWYALNEEEKREAERLTAPGGLLRWITGVGLVGLVIAGCLLMAVESV